MTKILASAPPTVATAPHAKGSDAFRLTWYTWKGLCYGAWRSRGRRQLFLLAVLFLTLIAIPALVAWLTPLPLLVVLVSWIVLLMLLFCALYFFRISCRYSRWTYYTLPDRSSFLGVKRTEDGWTVGDHVAGVLRDGRGAALRDVLIPPLTKHADMHEITVEAVAATEKQRDAYLIELGEGTEVVGRVCIQRGYRLRRLPQPLSSPGASSVQNRGSS